MPDRTPSPQDIAHWPEDMRHKHTLLAQKQYDAYERLERTLKQLTPRQFRKAIASLLAFSDARDELLFLNGYMACIDFVYGKGEEVRADFPVALIPIRLEDGQTCSILEDVPFNALVIEKRQTA